MITTTYVLMEKYENINVFRLKKKMCLIWSFSLYGDLIHLVDFQPFLQRGWGGGGGWW